MSDHKIPVNCHWTAHEQLDVVYDLSHLNPFYLTITAPPKEGKPTPKYECIVQFSIHCFTKESDSTQPPNHHYSDSRETRLFCLERYELSLQLPDIIKKIDKGLNTRKGNFLIVKMRNYKGEEVEYEVYFQLSRSSQERGKLNFYIQSAFPRRMGVRQKDFKPMRLHIIAYKTLNKKGY